MFGGNAFGWVYYGHAFGASGDTGTATITLSGSFLESYSTGDTDTCTITLSGSFVEVYSLGDSQSGTITLSGSSSDTYSQGDSGNGTLTLSGSASDTWANSDTGSGTLALSGLGTGFFNVPVGVCIAFTDDAYTATPSWTTINTSVQAWSIQRGRSFELDKTQTGSATIQIIDTNGTFDPTNASGPHYGNLDPDKQIAIFLTNPITHTVSTLFRGFVEDITVNMDVSEKFSQVEITAVDLFDKLANTEVIPDGSYGDTVPAASAGDVFYVGQQVDDRIKAALADAGIPVDMQRVFSGNVAVQGTVYASRSPILQVVQDAADAEFPGVANVFVSKDGMIVFHGRLARFDPASYRAADDASRNAAQSIVFWKAGDTAAFNSSPSDTAVITGLSFERSKTKIINAALATPQGIADSAVAGQVVTDTGSTTTHGVRSQSWENLITDQGDEAGTPDADAETLKFAQYYVDNYAAARNRVSQIRITNQPATTTYAATWDLLGGVDIGDKITVTTSHPGGGGFNEDFFVEGVEYGAQPMGDGHPQIVLTLDLSPTAYFATDPGFRT